MGKKNIDVTGWQNRHLKVAEVALVLGVSTATVWRWAKIARIPQPNKLGQNVTRWEGAALAAKINKTSTQDRHPTT